MAGINPNPNMSQEVDEPNFDVSDFFEFNDWIDHEDSSIAIIPGYPQNPSNALNEVANPSGSSTSPEGPSNRDIGNSEGKRERFAFRTLSQVEVLSDGFKWRKYGKKMVKNSPNPRNYFKCQAEGCLVKKRIERDNDDPRYVITTYEGIHNHLRPS